MTHMRTVIFEGIATSGKSTIIEQLAVLLGPQSKLKIVLETETLMNIVDNTDKSVSIAYLIKLIDRVYAEDSDIVIFDRLYLTHIFRTHSSMADFKAIEDILRPFMPETVFLEIDEGAIADRVAKASEHRDPKWKEYIFTKGQTIDEVADYYIQQQRNQLQLLQKSTLAYRICNTTYHNYQDVIRQINSYLG